MNHTQVQANSLNFALETMNEVKTFQLYRFIDSIRLFVFHIELIKTNHNRKHTTKKKDIHICTSVSYFRITATNMGKKFPTNKIASGV